MSKAFTKEDDGEPSVRRRRAPLPAGSPNYVTPRGLQALRDELAALTELDRHAPAASDRDARSAWRTELEHRLATAVLAPPPDHPGEVRFGARVRLRTVDGDAREVQIVGVDEADAAHGLVAFTAPLARALLGARAGALVTVTTPGGSEELEVVDVAY